MYSVSRFQSGLPNWWLGPGGTEEGQRIIAPIKNALYLAIIAIVSMSDIVLLTYNKGVMAVFLKDQGRSLVCVY